MIGDEVHAGTDVARGEFLDELGPVNAQLLQVQPQGVDVPGRLRLGPFGRSLQFGHDRKSRLILPDDLAPPLLELGQFVQLLQPQGGLNVGHVALEAREDDLVIPGTGGAVAFPGVAAHPVKAPDARTIYQVRLACDHPPFRRGKVFGGVEGEAGC